MGRVILLIFGLIGAAHIFVGFLLCFKHVTEILDRKKSSGIWYWVYIIITLLGYYALFEMVKLI